MGALCVRPAGMTLGISGTQKEVCSHAVREGGGPSHLLLAQEARGTSLVD